MFRLLSKESNIFSVPLYIAGLLALVILFNIFDFSNLDLPSSIVTFLGIALGYFCFHAIALNYQSHLPLFMYSFFIFGFYHGILDIGIAVTLLTNSFLLLLLTNQDSELVKKSYVLVGALLAIDFIFLPTSWPLIVFVILHIIFTSGRVPLHLFRLLFGGVLIAFTYFAWAFFAGYNSWDEAYFPFYSFKNVQDYSTLYPLVPLVVLFVYALFDHFIHFNKKSPTSKFRYTFLLLFAAAQYLTIILYMGNEYQYLILLAFPASVILSRMLLFLPRYWMKELGLLLIIACLVYYKINYYLLP